MKPVTGSNCTMETGNIHPVNNNPNCTNENMF